MTDIAIGLFIPFLYIRGASRQCQNAVLAYELSVRTAMKIDKKKWQR